MTPDAGAAPSSPAGDQSADPTFDGNASDPGSEGEPANEGQSILIPRSAVDMHGSSPEEGDPVEFSVTGSMMGKEGEFYRVSLETANGKDMPADEAEDAPGAPGESTDDMESNIRGMIPGQ